MSRRRDTHRRGGPWRILALAIPCALVAIGALAWSAGLFGTGGTEPSDTQQEEQPLEEVLDQGVIEELEGDEDVSRALERAKELADAPAKESSADAFMEDLARFGDGAHASAAVRWTVPGDLVEPTQEVVRAYEGLGDAKIMTSGYLDIQGNVWSALIQGGDEWVDFVLVTTTGESGETTVRVVRMFAVYEEE